MAVPYNSIFGEVVLPVLLDPVANDLWEHPWRATKGPTKRSTLRWVRRWPRFYLTYLVG